MTLFPLMYMSIVILCLACYSVAYSPILYFHERNGCNLTALDDIYSYFNGLCNDFSKCPDDGKAQFAALTIEKLNADEFKPPKPENHQECENMMKQAKNNYAVALPTGGHHSERQLLDKLKDMTAWSNGPKVVDVYLFSYLSPCNDCAKDIVKAVKDNTHLKLHLSWQEFYQVPNQHQSMAFFRSLETLFQLGEDKLKVYWKNDKAKCGNFEKKISYQYQFYESLVKSFKSIDTPTAYLAKIVNKLTHACIDKMDDKALGNQCVDTWLKNPKNEIKNKDIFMNCKPKPDDFNLNKPLLGPPLNPNTPLYGSQSLDDLHGNYPGLW